MALKFQLSNNLVGHITPKYDPIGINTLTKTIKRSTENDGVFYEIVIDIDFIKDGRFFIKKCYEMAGGIDAEILVKIFEKNPNTRRWDLYFTGRVNMTKWELTENKVSVAIEQTGFEKRVLNLLETDVDLETTSSHSGGALAPNTVLSAMQYHSKAILKEYKGSPIDSTEYAQPAVIVHEFGACEVGPCDRPRDVSIFGFIDSSDETLRELDQTFAYPYTFLEQDAELVEQYRADEGGIADIDIKYRVKFSVYATQQGTDNDIDIDGCGSGILANRTIKFNFLHLDKDGNVKTLEEFGEYTSIAGCGGYEAIGSYETHTYQASNVTIEVGDKIFVYFVARIWGTYELAGTTPSFSISHEYRVQADKANTYINIISKTTASTSTAKSIMLYEAVQRCCQYYTNQADCFRSTLLGRPEILDGNGNPIYDSDGDAALIALTNGNNLRGRNKQIFTNLQDLVDFLNSAFCVGLGFEKVDDKQVLRLEKKEYFYNKNSKILSLGKVYNITRKVDSKRFFNQFECGYAGKLDIGQTNAIDEFNTIRRYGIPVVNTKNQLKVATKMRASGYQIEYQRRLSSSTADGKLDDENFVVCVIRDGGTFKSRKNEGFTITNVYDAGTGYNYPISPGRNFRNWLKVIGSSLIRSTNKTIKFTFGELNFTMTSQKSGETTPIAENGNVSVASVEPIWDNELYTFRHKLTRDEMKLIEANPYGYIEFEDQYGEVMEGFVQNISHEPNEKMADFELLKVFRP